MLRVNFRNHHRHVRRPAVRAVVGDNRRFGFGVRFLNRADFFFCHVYRGKDKIHGGCDFFYFIYIFNYNIFDGIRHRRIHFPAPADGFFIAFARASLAGGNRRHLKPRVVLQKGDKTLPHHTCSA